MLKFILITIVSLFILNTAIAQKADSLVYYLNSSGKIVSSKNSADFFLVILPPDKSKDKDLYIIKQYYPNGKLYFITGSKTKKIKKLKFEGTYISYYPNGNKKKLCTYDNGESLGDETTYYPNGKLYKIKLYNNGKNLLLDQCRDSTGKVLAENGNGTWIEYYNDSFDSKNEEGKVKNGTEEGVWMGKLNDSTNVANSYLAGKVMGLELFDNNGTKIFPPEFNGGLKSFGQYLAKSVRYPVLAFEQRIEGDVVVSFIVEKNGSLSNVKIVKSSDSIFDEEALRVIKNSPLWKPGLLNGKPVRHELSVPISFALYHD